MLCVVKFQSTMFKVGQKIVCIKSSTTATINVVEGEIYTVTGYSKFNPRGVLLKEAVSNPVEAGF